VNIQLIDYTKRGAELLILSKNTRHLSHPNRFNDILKMTGEEKESELNYVFGTIGSSFEFVNYVFLIQDVTRAFTHQLVRHRAGTSFAQQSLRVADATGFSYFIPDEIEEDQYQLAIYNSTMNNIQEGYKLLLQKGANIQDARGVLPTNICTNILLGINLRALSTLMETRLCVRAQGEFQEAALFMKSLVENVHPWARDILLPCCSLKLYCPWKNFHECPIKKANSHLTPDASTCGKIYNDWESVMEHRYSPQPKQHKGDSDGKTSKP